MKKMASVFGLMLFISLANLFTRQSDFPKLTGPYLGQTLPGATPEIFAPGIVSSKEFVDCKLAFSPEGTECYFYRLSHPSDELIPTIFFTKVENGIWTKPAKWQITQGAKPSMVSNLKQEEPPSRRMENIPSSRTMGIFGGLIFRRSRD